MERFFGFDLGDAESAVAVLNKGTGTQPEMLKIRDAKSIITAYARLKNQELLIGENACYHPDAVERKLRFKSRFLTDSESHRDIKCFAAGVLGELYLSGDLVQNEDCCFYVGCPAGWEKDAREQYRFIFEKIGYPPVKIISESRAALVSACQSKHLQVGYDILSHPVLVVDIGSSTTDFAYIAKGKEVELRTAGEVRLGGGLMDEILLEESVAASKQEREIRSIFAKSEPWRSYCEFAARRLKEKYYADEAYWKENECSQTVTISYDKTVRLKLVMNAEVSEKILNRKNHLLNGRSFHEVFVQSLNETKKNITGEMPELIFMTGGVSRLDAVRDWCREVYPDAVIITEIAPEFSVARGLAYCGRIDEETREFMQDLENLKDSSIVEQIVASNISELYERAVESLTKPILTNAVLPVIDEWREGRIARLSEIDEILQKEITAYLHTEEARDLLVKPVAAWLKPVSYELEEHTVPICVKHGVPYRALSLNSYLSLSEIDIRVDAKNVFAVGEITWMIDTIISLIVALLCGGSGIALVANGLPGMIAGAVVSLLILLLGKDRMEEALLKANLPMAVRKLFPKRYFRSRLDNMTEEVEQSLFETLQEEKNEEITDRLVSEISGQIEECLSRMAKVVEIPLG
ncbi:MAG: Hsp70 family protein [Lachnospiraceae bacterium]|nr:Hsp70 family protein [Lachnospiraceae bacterium]